MLSDPGPHSMAAQLSAASLPSDKGGDCGDRSHDRRLENCSKLAHDLSFRVLDPKHHGRLIGVFTHVPTAWISFGHVASRCLEFEQTAQRNHRVIETGILGSLFGGGGNNEKKIGHVCSRGARSTS